MAQRGPQLLLLVAEFILAPRVVLYAGCEDGRIQVVELLAQSSRIKEVRLVATPAVEQSRGEPSADSVDMLGQD